jgi:hypothetical protein
MAEAKSGESSGAPYAFRCDCSSGRAKASTGIPLWSKKYFGSYEISQGLKSPTSVSPEPTPLHSKDPIAVEPEAIVAVSTLAQAGVGVLSGPAFGLVQDCVDASKRGIPLQAQPSFGKLVKQYGKEAVLAAVRSIRLRDSEAPVA